MNNRKKLILVIPAFVLAVTFYGFYSWSTAGCEITQEYAKSRIIEYLSKSNLNPKYLEFDKENSNSCKISFIYKNEKEHISFSVVGGGKITKWNHNERG